MAFILQISSTQQLSFDPEYDYQEDHRKIEHRHRARSSDQYIYHWATYRRLRFSVEYVNSEFMSVINSWWESNTGLQFYEQGSPDVSSVKIANRGKPISKRIRPYNDQFMGTIELEGY